jgi:hypothetical protein
MFLAKAIYDNASETPDELAFRRGDVLTVIEQDPNDLQGWWLCSIRGKRGIVPANRLQSLAAERAASMSPPKHNAARSHNASWKNWQNETHNVSVLCNIILNSRC